MYRHEILGPGLHKRFQGTMKGNGRLTIITSRTIICSERTRGRTNWKQVYGSASDWPAVRHIVAVPSDNVIICVIWFEKYVVAICDAKHDTGPKSKVRYRVVQLQKSAGSVHYLSRICSLSSFPFARRTASCLACVTWNSAYPPTFLRLRYS